MDGTRKQNQRTGGVEERQRKAHAGNRLLGPRGITCHSQEGADVAGNHHAWCCLALLAVETSSQGRRLQVYGQQ